MSSPNFDEILKGKLDEISPTYHPSVWNRIGGKLRPVSFWMNTAATIPWAIAAACSLGILFMIFQTRDLKDETKKMQLILDSTLRQVENNQRLILAQKSKRDTVYLQSQANTGANSTTSSSKQGETDWLRKAFQDGYKAAIKQFQRETFASAQSFFSSEKSNSGIQPKENYFSNKEGKFSGLKQGLESTSKLGNGETSKFENQQIVGMKSEDSANTETTPKQQNQIITTDSIKKFPLQAPEKKKENPFRFSNLQPRLGLEAVGNFASLFGIGPGAEFRFFDNIGFNIGLLAYTGPTQKFDSEGDFNSATSLDFRKLYQGFLGNDPPNRIEEIEIKVSTIEIPLRIKYYIPIRDRFAFIPFAGTHFNISTQENVRCEWYYDYREEHQSFANNPKTRLFHNYIFGFGIERKGEKIIWQLAPWYTYNFRKSSNFELNNTFGLSLQIWLPLYRD